MVQSSFPVLNLPTLSGDSSRARRGKGEPILKCRRCAKEEEDRQKREKGIGCGYEAPPETPDEETSEATLDLGCDKCKGRRKKKRIPNTSIMPSGMLNLQGRGMLGQVPLAQAPDTLWSAGRSPELGRSCPGHARLGQTCPAGAVPLDPTLNCQRDARGNTVCSNGLYFPPGCPKTPPEDYFSPGIAPDEVHGSILEAKIPPARGTPGAPPLVGSDMSTPGAAPGTGSSAGSNILPYAAGSIAAIGLLYAILR